MNASDPPTPTRRNCEIRDARPHDAPAIASFNVALARETEGKELDHGVLAKGVAAALADPDRLRYWVATDGPDGPVIGQAAVTREWSDWRNGWVWWLQSVYVHQDHRRGGTFRSLFEAIRGAARGTDDVVGLRLYVERENRRAQQTYEALGMTPGGYSVFEEIWPDRFSR